MGFVRDRTYSDAKLVIEYNDYEVSTSIIHRRYDCCISLSGNPSVSSQWKSKITPTTM